MPTKSMPTATSVTSRSRNRSQIFPEAVAMATRLKEADAVLPGEGVGGTGIHWGALHWRFLPSDFRIRTVLTDKYGTKAIPETMTIQDWPFSYDEIESCYDRFDKLCGVSGQAGNLRGRIVPG